MSDVIDETPTDDAPVRTRRGAGGRLYHGETSIDFHGRRFIGLGLSGVLLLVSLLTLLFGGLNLSLEFKGGVVWDVPSETLTEARARAILDENDIDGASARVQILSSAEAGRTVSVQVGDQSDEVRQAVQKAFATEVGASAEDVATTSVSSTWGKSITSKALRALVVFFVLVAMFISWRLQWQMALAAIGAMLHDVLLSVGLYSLFGFEVTPATVVAFLTILGFSLYDTIVVFDKLSENQERYHGSRMPYADIVNVSMNQVLMRSLNTSLAAVLPLLSLLVIGAGVMGASTLSDFALALLVGLLTGSYSSIFVAAPIVTLLREREPRFKPLMGRHATGAELERLVLGGTPSVRRDPSRQRSGEVDRPAPKQEGLTHEPRPRKKKRRV
jgi:preprotein translocase subunit SecF